MLDRWRSLIVMLGALLGVATPALAQNKLVTNLSLFYFDQDAVRNVASNNTTISVKEQTNYTFFGLGVCYSFNSFCFGLKYIQDDISAKSTLASTSSEILTRINGVGLSAGYTSDALEIHAIYFMNATKSVKPLDLRNYGDSGSADVLFPAKTAYQFDIGYGFKVASVRIGPQLSILSLSYAKAKFQGQSYTLPLKEKDDLIVPQLGLWVDL